MASSQDRSGGGSGITRRELVGVGAAAATGMAALGLPELAAARTRARVASGPTDRRGVGFVLRIDQDGPNLIGIGYLTRVQRMTASDLFTKTPPTSSSDPLASDPSIARLTCHATATIESIAKLEDEITATGNVDVRIYHREYGGATFDDPGSFAGGTEIAAFAGTFQNGLAVTTPNHADVSLIADLSQKSAQGFSLGGRKLQFGHKGLPWGMQGHGRGLRTDAATPKSQLFLTGTFGVVDARGA